MSCWTALLRAVLAPSGMVPLPPEAEFGQTMMPQLPLHGPFPLPSDTFGFRATDCHYDMPMPYRHRSLNSVTCIVNQVCIFFPATTINPSAFPLSPLSFCHHHCPFTFSSSHNSGEKKQKDRNGKMQNTKIICNVPSGLFRAIHQGGGGRNSTVLSCPLVDMGIWQRG